MILNGQLRFSKLSVFFCSIGDNTNWNVLLSVFPIYCQKITSMIASEEDVGIFLRALNDGVLFSEGEQEIYSSIYEYDHTEWVPGYQSIARYHKDIDTVVIQFMNTTGGYNWNLMEIVYSRIVKILRNKKVHNNQVSITGLIRGTQRWKKRGKLCAWMR
jgi:hypothetical protein